MCVCVYQLHLVLLNFNNAKAPYKIIDTSLSGTSRFYISLHPEIFFKFLFFFFFLINFVISRILDRRLSQRSSSSAFPVNLPRNDR